MVPNQIVNKADLVYLQTRDEIFVHILENCGIPPEWERPQGVESLVRIILEQQVSLASAYASYQKVKVLNPGFCTKIFLEWSDNTYKDCYVSRQKASYIRHLSKTIEEGHVQLSELAAMDEETVHEKLTSIKGIGPWTASIYQIFCLKSRDIFPPRDAALLTAFRELDEIDGYSQLVTRAVAWSPCRSLATFCLWHYYLVKRGRSPLF